jgi:hypothetical protein
MNPECWLTRLSVSPTASLDLPNVIRTPSRVRARDDPLANGEVILPLVDLAVPGSFLCWDRCCCIQDTNRITGLGVFAPGFRCLAHYISKCLLQLNIFQSSQACHDCVKSRLSIP